MSKRIVIDASVALKWRLRDEEAMEQVDALLEHFLSQELVLIVPTLFDYEIANALKVAVVRERLAKEEADKIIEEFQGYVLWRYDFVSPCSQPGVTAVTDRQIGNSILGLSHLSSKITGLIGLDRL